MAGGQLLTVRYWPAGGFAHDPSQIVTARYCRGEWWRPIDKAMRWFPRDAFDYVWLLNPPAYDPELNRGLVPIWRSGRDVLFRVDHSQDAALREDGVGNGQPLFPRRKGVSSAR